MGEIDVNALDDEKAPEPVAPDIEPVSDDEDIEKNVLHKEWTFEAEYDVQLKGDVTSKTFKRTYTQKPLSYLAFAEFTGLVSRKIREAMRGPDGLSMDRMALGELGLPLEFNDGKISVADDISYDSFIQGIMAIASYVPEFLAEAQCIWLRVPRGERALLVDIWSRPVDEGGLSMDQGEEMLNVFIEQNYEELMSFLKRYARVKSTVQKMKNRNNQSDG